MGAGSQLKPVMIQKGMNAQKSVQANKIILLNNLKKNILNKKTENSWGEWLDALLLSSKGHGGGHSQRP